MYYNLDEDEVARDLTAEDLKLIQIFLLERRFPPKSKEARRAQRILYEYLHTYFNRHSLGKLGRCPFPPESPINEAVVLGLVEFFKPQLPRKDTTRLKQIEIAQYVYLSKEERYGGKAGAAFNAAMDFFDLSKGAVTDAWRIFGRRVPELTPTSKDRRLAWEYFDDLERRASKKRRDLDHPRQNKAKAARAR